MCPETLSVASQRCFACGGYFAASDGPTHAYMLSTPGCWAAYGELLAREYESPTLFGATHRLTVDAYALQHSGNAGDRRAVQSVWVHFAALFLILEGGKPFGEVTPLMRRLAKSVFPPLPAGPKCFVLTHADVLAAPPQEHVSAVRSWANSAYEAWAHLRGPTQDLLASL
jgi:hypothetical protein